MLRGKNSDQKKTPLSDDAWDRTDRWLFSVPDDNSHMTKFDPEKFERKYQHYFNELQQAYRNAFETMNDRYDSELVHAIDQGVLSESEPFYEGDGEFRVEVPDDAVERIETMASEEKIETTLERYVAELEAELASVFGFSDENEGASPL